MAVTRGIGIGNYLWAVRLYSRLYWSRTGLLVLTWAFMPPSGIR